MSILYDCFYNSNITLHVHYFVYIILHACIYIYIHICVLSRSGTIRKEDQRSMLHAPSDLNKYVHIRTIHFPDPFLGAWLLSPLSLHVPCLPKHSVPLCVALAFLVASNILELFQAWQGWISGTASVALQPRRAHCVAAQYWRIWTALVASCGDVVSLTFADVLFA